jgi:hypothetical protein
VRIEKTAEFRKQASATGRASRPAACSGDLPAAMNLMNGNGFSLLESVFAWVMIGGGVAILIGVRWRPMKLWQSRRSRGGLRAWYERAHRKPKTPRAPSTPTSTSS